MATEEQDLSDTLSAPVTLENGMAWVLYTDNGPAGLCGQSMDITCPHTVLHLWPSEQAMRDELGEKDIPTRRGKQQRIAWGVVGETATGKTMVVQH